MARLCSGRGIFAAAGIAAFAVIGAGLAAAQQAAPDKPVMAEEQFKNIRALRGIPVDDFMQTMGLMSVALQFDCSDCHQDAGTDKVNWAADTPRKIMARAMVNMVTNINKNNFGGRQMVTCWTCHRNRDKPLTTPVMDVLYGMPPYEPDDVVGAIPGLQFREMPLSDLCCGSAGIYNVLHTDMALALLEKKMHYANATPAEVIATANPGCMLQLRAGVQRHGKGQRVAHVVELLDEAYNLSPVEAPR